MRRKHGSALCKQEAQQVLKTQKQRALAAALPLRARRRHRENKSMRAARALAQTR